VPLAKRTAHGVRLLPRLAALVGRYSEAMGVAVIALPHGTIHGQPKPVHPEAQTLLQIGAGYDRNARVNEHSQWQSHNQRDENSVLTPHNGFAQATTRRRTLCSLF
jgi:hypothetical protein